MVEPQSSLLKLIARVLPPTSGVVKVDSLVAPMLELGAGFNPELSGEENILLFGVLLGNRTKEMQSRVADIAEWAGLTEHIKLPVVAVESGAIAEIVENGRNEILTSLDLIEIANQLSGLFSNPRQRMEISHSAFNASVINSGDKKMSLDHILLYKIILQIDDTDNIHGCLTHE